MIGMNNSWSGGEVLHGIPGTPVVKRELLSSSNFEPCKAWWIAALAPLSPSECESFNQDDDEISEVIREKRKNNGFGIIPELYTFTRIASESVFCALKRNCDSSRVE